MPIEPLSALLAVAGLAVAAALWVVVQRVCGRYTGEEYPMDEEVGRCGSCASKCRE